MPFSHTFARGCHIAPVLLALSAFSSLIAGAPAITLVEEGRSRCVIVHARDERLGASAAHKLAAYLAQQTDAVVPVFPENAVPPIPAATAIVVIDGSSGHRLAARYGLPVGFSAGHPDGYQLTAAAGTTASATVLAAGRGASGAKYAVYRLMRELHIRGRTATIDVCSLEAEPFIKTRSVALFNVWSMPIELTRRHNTESWSDSRLEQYVDMFDVFGFNAIESHDRFNDNYLQPLFGLSRAEWREKVQRMCDHAHANGQQFFLRIWGHVVMETPPVNAPLGPTAAVPKRLRYLCVNDPAERGRWEEEILRYYVSNYAGRVDNLIGHWCDPGVCRKNGCDFRTPLRLQMELHRAFKAVDPHFTSTFSLWFFDVTKNNAAGWARRGWAGYETDLDLINAGILAKDVAIATATTQPNSYREDIVRAIEAAGHKPAVWTWYRADHEIRPSLHVHLHERLGDYFRTLPPSARDLEWHNIERNVHGAANTATYYVAGRLMWDPSLDVAEVLREFLSLVYGPANASKIAPAYEAIERIRCHSCFKNWESARFTGAGTSDPKSDFAVASSALAQLESVRIDSDFRPRLRLDIPPAQVLLDLRASLEVIRDFARCRAEDMPAIERAIAGGNSAAARRDIDRLQTQFGGWTHTLAGRQEWTILDAFLKEKLQQLDGSAPGRRKNRKGK